MAYSAPSQLELTISSARDLKNVNWRYGPLNAYAILWVEPGDSKFSTRIDRNDGDTSPRWDETLVIPLSAPVEDSTLFIDIVHANAEYETKPLIGSTRLKLKEVVEDAGFNNWDDRCLKLKRPSGRPQGKVEVKFFVRGNPYRAHDQYYAQPQPAAYYDRSSYEHHSQYSASDSMQNVGGGGYAYEEEKKSGGSKYGMGTGIAVGAVAGVLGGLALAEGIDYVDDKIDDEVEERVEEELEERGYEDE